MQKRRQHLFVVHVLGRWVLINPPTVLRGYEYCFRNPGGCTRFAAFVWTMLGKMLPTIERCSVSRGCWTIPIRVATDADPSKTEA